MDVIFGHLAPVLAIFPLCIVFSCPFPYLKLFPSYTLLPNVLIFLHTYRQFMEMASHNALQQLGLRSRFSCIQSQIEAVDVTAQLSTGTLKELSHIKIRHRPGASFVLGCWMPQHNAKRKTDILHRPKSNTGAIQMSRL